MRDRPSSVDFRSLFEASPGLYLVLQPDFTIVGASDAYLAATMTRRQDIVGRGIFDVFPDNPADIHADGVLNLRASLARALSSRRPDTMPIQRYDIRTESGEFEERFWSPLNKPVLGEDGNVQMIIHRVEDVTAYVRLLNAEQARQAQVDNLRCEAVRMETEILARAQEIARANSNLRQMHASLEKVQTEKDLLTGMIIHDLRNPLSACLGHLELAIDLQVEADSRLSRHLDGARSAATRLRDMINGIIDIIRMEDGMMPTTLTNVDIGTLIDAKVRQYQGAATQSDLVLVHRRADPSLHHITDGTLLDRVLDNLLTNAIKHTPRGGSVIMRSVRTLDDDKLSIQITDTGEGIAAGDLGRLFQKYGRIEGQTMGRSHDTGLGLVFCRMAVELLHGSIGVVSEMGKGSTFTITLPDLTQPRPAQPT